MCVYTVDYEVVISTAGTAHPESFNTHATPSEWGEGWQIVPIKCLDLNHTPPDSGERMWPEKGDLMVRSVLTARVRQRRFLASRYPQRPLRTGQRRLGRALQSG